MEFKDIVMGRYACKRFDGRKVPEGKIKELLELMRHAPSSYNLQPWKFIIISDDGLKKRLKPASKNQDQIDSCSHLIVICADTGLSALADKLDTLLEEQGILPEKRNARMAKVRTSMMKKSEEEARLYAQKQCYIALGNALNGAKSLGLDSCPMEGFDKDAYAKILELPKHLIPTVLCPIGYAADTPRKKIRHSDIFERR